MFGSSRFTRDEVTIELHEWLHDLGRFVQHEFVQTIVPEGICEGRPRSFTDGIQRYFRCSSTFSIALYILDRVNIEY